MQVMHVPQLFIEDMMAGNVSSIGCLRCVHCYEITGIQYTNLGTWYEMDIHGVIYPEDEERYVLHCGYLCTYTPFGHVEFVMSDNETDHPGSAITD